MVETPKAAEVVVVGGGVMGASALYHLATAGCSDAVLVERSGLASGSTSAAAGGIRAQFSDELNIRIGLECIDRFARFEDEVGADIDFHQDGYLFLLGEEHEAAFRASLALQRELGVPVEWLQPQAAGEIVPGLRVDDLVGATFSPSDGVATPEAVAQGYVTAARRLGARAVENCPVTAIRIDGEEVVGVDTASGPIDTPRVVLAAGVWSRELGATAGVDIPVVAERRHVWFTDPFPGQPDRLPLTVDFATSFYFHPEGDGLLIGGREPSLDEVVPHAAHRLPALADAGIRGGWSGDYEMSPDHNAIVGMTAGGLAYATGFSGHGFQQAPVVGEHLAELVLGLETTFDLGAFGLDRFREGAVRAEQNVI